MNSGRADGGGGAPLLVFVVDDRTSLTRDAAAAQADRLLIKREERKALQIVVARVDPILTGITAQSFEPRVQQLVQIAPRVEAAASAAGLTAASFIERLQHDHSPSVMMLAISEGLLLFDLALQRWRADYIARRNQIPFWKCPIGGLTDIEETQDLPVTDVNPDARGAYVRDLITFLCKDEGPILLEGETGTGKTQTARLIHYITRPEGKFHVENIGALASKEDREGLLRGIAKRKYTGSEGRVSIFEEYDGGTVVLDDFHAFEPPEQVTLLDLLRPFSTRISGRPRLGEKAWNADVQVVLTVNEDIDTLIRSQRLRSDIYSRVQRRFPTLPTLRSRLGELAVDRDIQRCYLRLVLLEMQERAIRIRTPQWFKSSETPAESLRRQLQLDDQWRPLWRRIPSVDMPLSKVVLDHPWPGNFRDLAAFARELRDATDGKIAKWSEEVADSVLAKIRKWSVDTSAETTLVRDSDQRPRRLMALAFFRAVTRPGATRASVAEDLCVHPKPLGDMLDVARGGTPRGRPSARRAARYLEDLEPEERAALQEAATRLLEAGQRPRRR